MKFAKMLAWLGLVTGAILGAPALSPACPFCNGAGETYTMAIDRAGSVLFGIMKNPVTKLNADGTETGTTDLVIEEIIKPHADIKDKMIVLPRYVPVNAPGVDPNIKWVVFIDLFKGQLDPYRAVPVTDKNMGKYLKEIYTLRDKDIPTRLKFLFDYLENPETEISTDAYKEFSNADAKEVMKMVEIADRSKVRGKLVEWIKSKDTAPYRFGLYGYVLGLCGTTHDASVLTELLNDPERGLVSGIDGVLAGLIMLQPETGWKFVKDTLSDPSKDFVKRYAALRTVRFLWEFRPELVTKADMLAALDKLNDQSDIADLSIEDLRKWQQWSMIDRLLEVARKESHQVPIIQRAILRFMLSCPDKKAVAFVAERRKRDPNFVKDVEELLNLDKPMKPVNAGNVDKAK